MHTTTYYKHFTTGNLAGLTVPCKVSHVDAEHALRFLEALARHTTIQQGRDCVTGARYWVSF